MMLADELPEHTAFQYTYTAVEGKMAFLEWAYEDSTTRVRDGADSYSDRERQDRGADDPLHRRAEATRANVLTGPVAQW